LIIITDGGEMKKSFNITMNVKVEVEKADDGRRIPWISFKGWKYGIVSKENRFIDTDAIVKMTDENMIYIGKAVFEAAKEMFYEDEELKE
jgi:hypothetical protein